MRSSESLTISAPGRVCLFGEHQDYLGLPVIPAAISLRITLTGRRRTDDRICIDLPDIRDQVDFPLTDTTYREKRDYFRSGINVMRREGFSFATGFDCSVHGNIPINSGTSSSTALITAWIQFLGLMSEQQAALSPAETARLAHLAEVVEFDEPGGMMDHYSIALGDILYLEFQPEVTARRLPASLGTFVLGDSGEPKDTIGILARVKDQVREVTGRIERKFPEFSLSTVARPALKQYRPEMTEEQFTLLEGTVENRELTVQAAQLLNAPAPDEQEFGRLLNRHQAVLRDVLRISTPQIDRMLAAALEAGAYGGKINGSGGGGCMFVYAPEHPERVARAIRESGGTTYIVDVDQGVQTTSTTAKERLRES